MNKLYFGDNLEILREFEPNSIDLICTDPPLQQWTRLQYLFSLKGSTESI